MSWGGVAIGVGAVASAGIGMISGEKQSKAQIKSAEKSADMQFQISQQQIDMAKEQWSTYKETILPMEIEAQRLGIDARELAQQRGELDFELYEDYYAPMQEQFATEAMDGVEADPERAAREARLSVDQAFDTEEGMIRRNLERRGVRPGSGADVSGGLDTSLNRAAAKGYTVNRAVEAERDRVEDVNFNRKAVALGRQPLAPGSSQGGGSQISPSGAMYGMSAAGQTAGSAGNMMSRLGMANANAVGSAMSGAFSLGVKAYDAYNKYSSPKTTQQQDNAVGGGGQWGGGGSGTFNTNYSPSQDPTNFGYAEGGVVSLKRSSSGYAEGGEVNGPEGYDAVPAYIEGPNGERQDTALTTGEFVIPADVVSSIGTDTLDDIIEKARQRKNNPQGTLSRRTH